MNKKSILNIIKRLHSFFVLNKRTHVLSSFLSESIPPGTSRILDIGCGNGEISGLIKKNFPDIQIQGVEVVARPHCSIDCILFNGKDIPFKASSFDICLFTDVLHHVKDARTTVLDAARVSKRYILVKDHICQNTLDKYILSFMDWVGNRPYKINLEYTYYSKEKWHQFIKECGLKIIRWNENIPLYPFPFNLLFGRHLHFIALLEIK